MDFPKAQNSPIIHRFFRYISDIKGKNTRPVYVLWMDSPSPEIRITPALLRSELFPDKCWFAVHFQKNEDFFSAKRQLKNGFPQDVLGHKVFFTQAHYENETKVLVFVADYPYEIDLSGFVKVLFIAQETIKYN